MDNDGFIHVRYSKSKRKKHRSKQKGKPENIVDDEILSKPMLGFRSEANYDKETAMRYEK